MRETAQVVAPHLSGILTPDQRPRVFVSSTLQELAPERVAARAGIEALGLIPVMFELGARPHPARALYRSYLAQSHVFVGVYFERYGWIAPGEDVSGLEDEYRLSGGVPRLVYLKAPARDREAALTAMLDRIRDDDTVAYKTFSSASELENLLRDDLAVLMAERFLLPPVSGALPGAGPSFDEAMASRLPRPVSSLVGREAEVAMVEDLLASGTRLVTVVGPGGIGKTRVAIEVAHRVSSLGSAAVSFVPLEGIEDPAVVLPEVAASIRLGLDGGVPAVDALTAVFADRPILLVMDNVEQVQAAASDIATLLEQCPQVSVLATSRVPLKIRGEQLVAIGPLGLPVPGEVDSWEDAAAVRLFVDRARAVRPVFNLQGAGDAEAVVEVCRRLDGIPLALELAAARSALLTPRSLLERLGSALDLASGAADAPARQRTMRDTLAWSQELLSQDQTALLARLSVYLAPWTLSDAEALADPAAGDVIDDLAGLVENSLVAPAADAPGEPRFRLYETVRAFASELLDQGSRERAEAAYTTRMLRQATDLSVGICSRDYERWADEFRLVWPDLRRAWELSIEREDAEGTAQASRSLLPLWLDGRVLAAADLIEPSIRLADKARPAHHGDLMFLCSQAMFNLGDYERAAAVLGRIGHDAVAPPADPTFIGGTSFLRGIISVSSEDLETPERELQRAVEELESAATTTALWLAAYAHNTLGSLFVVRGEVDRAIGEFDTSRKLARDSGNIAVEMQAQVFEAELRLAAGDRGVARDLLTSACDLVERRPFYEANAYCLEVVAALAAESGDTTAAARLLGLAAALREALGARIWALRETQTAQTHADVQSRSAPDAFQRAFAAGRALDPRSGASLCRAALIDRGTGDVAFAAPQHGG